MDNDWVPGDPLHEPVRHNYSGYIFNFRDQVITETCRCVDAASWPTPHRGNEIDPLWANLPRTSGAVA